MKARVGALFVILLVAAAALPAAAQATEARGRLQRAVIDASGDSRPSVSHLAGPVGPVTIGGTVLEYDGTPVEGAWVEWGWFDPNTPVWMGPDVVYHRGGEGWTGVGGAFSFAGITSSPGNDDLSAFGEDWQLSTWANDFSTTPTYVIRPGLVPVTIANWPDRLEAEVCVGDAASGGAWSSPRLTDDSGLAAAPAPGFDTVAVSFYGDFATVTAATEWISPDHAVVPIESGATVDQTITLDWAEAKRARLAGPRCRHSVRPGDFVTLVLENWPAGSQASFWGASWADESLLWYDSSASFDDAGETKRVRLRVPADAPLRAEYEIGTYRSDDRKSAVMMWDYVQLCRFAATRDSIERGQAIQVRGETHGYGPVVLFKRTKAASRPSSPAANGWTRVGSLSRRQGRFASAWMRPSRTTWYTVRYGGELFTAFTPVVKVIVR